MTIVFSFIVFSQENKPTEELIRIGDLFWDVKPNRNGIPWDEAVQYCAKKGMRLPTKDELVSYQDELMKLEEDPTVLRKDRDKINPFHTVNYLYWSSTEYEKNLSMVWIVQIRNNPESKGNNISPLRKNYKHSNVRCIKNADKI